VKKFIRCNLRGIDVHARFCAVCYSKMTYNFRLLNGIPDTMELCRRWQNILGNNPERSAQQNNPEGGIARHAGNADVHGAGVLSSLKS